MRLRTIKPGFFKNEDLAALPPLHRLLYAGLWCMADREGRLEDRPRRIKAELVPYDNLDIDKAIDSLASAGFVIRYTVAGHKYLSVPMFRKHQNPHVKEPASTVPAPDEPGACTVPAGQSLGSGEWGVGSSPTSSVAPPSAGVVEGVGAEKSNGKAHHPDADTLSEFHVKAARHWKATANVNPASSRSADGWDRLLKRAPADKVRQVLTWIFRGKDGDYGASPTFDWRPNLLSGASVEHSWDQIETLFDNALKREQEDEREGSRFHRNRAG